MPPATPAGCSAGSASPARTTPPPIAADVDVTAYSVAELAEVAAGAAAAGPPARLQLKVDTGLSRGGAPLATWDDVVAEARAGEQRGDWAVTGIWSHFACTDEPDHPANDAQEAAFRHALAVAERPGCGPRSATWPTPRPRSCARAPASTWSAAASRRTASTPHPGTPPTSGWCPR